MTYGTEGQAMNSLLSKKFAVFAVNFFHFEFMVEERMHFHLLREEASLGKFSNLLEACSRAQSNLQDRGKAQPVKVNEIKC